MTNENIIHVTDPKQFENMKYFQKYSFNCKNCGSFETRSFRRSHIKAHETLLCQKCLNVLWHGSVSPFSRPEVQEKSRKVMIEKYGAPTGLQSKTIREKINKTNLKRYGSKCSLRDPEVFAKAKETTQQKYGVDHALQSKEIYNKTIETLKKRYNVDNPFKSEEIRDKSKETLIEKYNVDNPMKSKEIQERAKQTCLDKYGVDNALKSPKIREISYQTKLEKYGTLHQEYKYNYYRITFDSSWELAIWIYCIDHNIPIIRNPCRFTYMYNNEKHYYEVDFMINGQLVEIKGDQFFDDTGNMIDIFDRSRDIKSEAKHQCGLQNNVLFWKQSECQQYIDYCNLYYPNWDNIYRKDNYYNPSYWVYYINNAYIKDYYNNSNYIKGIGISPYDIDKDSDYTICGKGISPFDINKNSE